jgi:hypothetical protein
MLVTTFQTFFLPLGATAQGELWPPEQSASNILYSSSITFQTALYILP